MTVSPESVPRDVWRRLQSALDARRDPLDDPEVCAWLEANPAELERFARWREPLLGATAVPETVAAAPWAAGPRRVAAIAAVVLVTAGVAVGGWLLLAPTPQRHDLARPSSDGPPAVADPGERSLPIPRLSATGRCVYYSTAYEIVGEREHAERKWEQGQVLARVRSIYRSVDETSLGGAVQSSSISRSSEEVVFP